MVAKSDYENAMTALNENTGIVIPVFLPPDSEYDSGKRLIENTTLSFLRDVSKPASVCLSADGPGTGSSVVREMTNVLHVSSVFSDRNRGKLNALRLGVAHLLEMKSFDFIAVVDQDGDHFANELPNLIRAAQYVRGLTDNNRLFVLGGRISRHKPLGFLRGELEALADRILLDALCYNAAVTGKPLALQFVSSMDAFPDFHSGYKVFSLQTAQDVFLSPSNPCGLSERAYYQDAVEAVISVEALTAGAAFIQVNRTTYDEQPLTTFGRLDRIELSKNMILWPCRRLNIPPHFIKQWLDNHIPELLLSTLVPDGQREILNIRSHVLKDIGMTDDPPARSRFV